MNEEMARGYYQNCYEYSWFHERNIRGREVHVQGKTTTSWRFGHLRTTTKCQCFVIAGEISTKQKKKESGGQCEVVLVFQKIEVMEQGVEKREVYCHTIFFPSNQFRVESFNKKNDSTEFLRRNRSSKLP